MCLAIPATIRTLEANNMAEVDIMGVTRHVSLDLVPEAKLGDHVLVHAGFAMQIIDEQFARETMELIAQLEFPEPEGA